MALNKSEIEKAMEEAKKRGYTPNSSGTGMTNGSTTIKPTASGGGVQTSKGDIYTDLSNLKKSGRW